MMPGDLRQDHIDRLASVFERWKSIDVRLEDWIQKAELGQRMGLGGQMDIPALQSMSAKAKVCIEACGESITALAVDFADPEIFTENIGHAENAASQYEQILNQLDDGASAGKRAFQGWFGKRLKPQD